jgi:hypothetical protein
MYSEALEREKKGRREKIYHRQTATQITKRATLKDALSLFVSGE